MVRDLEVDIVWQRLAWDWVMENHDTVREVCHRCAMGRAHLEDELFSEAVRVLPGVMRAHDPAKSPLDYHVKQSLRWYFYKYASNVVRGIKGVMRGSRTPVLLEDVHACTRSTEPGLDLTHRDEVLHILHQLSAEDVYLLVAHHVKGLTFAEIGESLDVSKTTARLHYLAALARARAACTHTPL